MGMNNYIQKYESKNNIEVNKSDTQKHILCNSIYMKFKARKLINAISQDCDYPGVRY